MLEIEYSEIESIEEIGEENTYDITMEDNPSFIANGIVVHNSGMRNLLKNLAVLNTLTFEDIAAATALYRPGPIDAGLVDKFIAVKQGKAVPEYEHPLMEPALKETYGVLTYQEQIQRVCIDLAGFTGTDADHVRRAMGKKDKAKMESYKGQFIAGASSGQIEVELEDGSKVLVHRAKKFKCADGVLRTVEEIMRDEVDCPSLT